MALHSIDWLIVIAFLLITLFIGLWVSRQSGKNTKEFFLSGRNMPWWILGVSMVATTFSADTPNLVTDIVRQNGVSGNWVWWAFLLTGMLTVFVFAKLWRRSKVLTDLEFYEMRYSGKPAAFLRGFRALYLGVFFNVMIMASVTLAAIKIGSILLGLTPIQTVLIASIVTVIYSSLGGLRGVLLTDLFQFVIAMIGSIGAAIVALNLPEVGGISGLISHANVVEKLNFLPDMKNPDLWVPMLLIPLAVQWWSTWYPGAEPGGGGYVAQRMLAARNEKHAMGATLFFNIAHYALRPWPWIIVALCSLIIFPDLESLKTAFPAIEDSVVKNDLAYPAMLSFLPVGLLGLVVASLIAAFMSTISTHLNWGSSYIVNDFYKRFVRQNADEKSLVKVGRVSTVALMIISAAFALLLENALQAFNILLQIGAGTGLVFILRWFWWRINAYTEISAMIISFLVAIYFHLVHERLGMAPLPDHLSLVYGVMITTIGWLTVTFLSPPEKEETLKKFNQLIQPGGPGMSDFSEKKSWGVPGEIIGMLVGSLTVYAALFATGFWIYGETASAIILSLISVVGSIVLFKLWNKANTN